jgi:hypothetical protein
MDREAAVLRAEMSRTRAELDDKLVRLQARVSELTPQRLTERYVPDYLVDRVIGGVLTAVGLRMAWSMYRQRRNRRERLRGALAPHWS